MYAKINGLFQIGIINITYSDTAYKKRGLLFHKHKNSYNSLLNKEDGDDVSEEIMVYESAKFK